MALFKEAEVRKLLTEYNTSVGEDTLNVDGICSALTKAGGGVSSVAGELSFEDIAKAGKLPAGVARAVAKLWRGNDEKPKDAPAAEVQVGGASGSLEDLAFIIGNVDSLNDVVLLKNYQPLGRSDIINALNERANGKPFIVFADNQSLRVDQDKSFDILQLLKQGVEVGSTTSVEGKLVELFRAGELPDLALNICPIHEVHLIGKNQFCPKCNRPWEGVSSEVRELAWVHVQNVLAEKPKAQDPRLQQIHAALGDPNDQYWAQAKLEHEKLKATGQPIVLVKPVKRAGR